MVCSAKSTLFMTKGIVSMKKCQNCGSLLVGIQRKFCCRKCKNDFNNQIYQSYLAQQKRGYERKRRLLISKGGKCAHCGYSRNSAALKFHHIDPREKRFQLDLRTLSNRKWIDIETEARKCILLCSNCHRAPDGHYAVEGCDDCHTPEGWIESAAASVVDETPPVPHVVEGRDNCLMCHDPAGTIQPAPADHASRTDEQCLLCHLESS